MGRKFKTSSVIRENDLLKIKPLTRKERKRNDEGDEKKWEGDGGK